MKQIVFSSHNGSLTLSKHHHRNQLKHYDESMKRVHGCKYQHCKPALKKTTSSATAGPAKNNDQASTNNLKLNVKAVVVSEV